MKKLVFIFFIFICFNSYIFAEDPINEDDLFSNPDLIITTDKNEDKVASDNKIKEEEEKKTVDFSGEIIGASDYTLSRDKDKKDNSLSSSVLADFFLDVRLKKGTKYFANLEILNNSQIKNKDSDFLFSIKESFIDFNIKDSVYFRTGKQVLQWGRCYLWNPSDVINVEKKTFIQKLGLREGTYGIKFHKPYGTKYNIYGFIDTKNATDTNELGFAGKYEFILGKTEMSFSGWNKKGFAPVYSYDFSSRFFGIDTKGEAAFSYGDNYNHIKTENGELSKYKEKDKWIPRASMNFGKQFDFMEVNDRISVNMEFYYNHTGLTENIFKDKNIYTFIGEFDSTGKQKTGTKKDYLLNNDLYEANNLSRYYAALFTSFNKFIISDMILTFNLISNLNDSSYIATTGVNYKDINDFSLGFNVYSYIGKTDREYTFSNNLIATRLYVGVVF
ncbi:MAG: hypothetical protein HY934_04550 [Candidatus Firestonebacteria bacterium]|nr:hypothetical protein [Candidatus Firestonebacteria bacterium]